MTTCSNKAGAFLLAVLSAATQASATAAPQTAATLPAREPGVLVRLYDIGHDMRQLPELAAGQTPNVARVAHIIDLRGERGDFGELKEQFMTEVTGFLKIDQAGRHAFHLTSDDGSRLWIDGRLVVDNDGAHPPTAKDGSVELTAGEHELHILHFQGGGGVQLTLEWQPPEQATEPRSHEATKESEPVAPATGPVAAGAPAGRGSPATDTFELVPAAVLAHAADAALETSLGKKKIIPPLRRGRPGDGTPVAGTHPSLIERSRDNEWRPTAEETAPTGDSTELGILGGRWLEMHALQTGKSAAPLVWLPWQSGAALCGPTVGDCLFVIGDGVTGSLGRVFFDFRGKTVQGCALRFSRGHPTGFQELLIDRSGTLQLVARVRDPASGQDRTVQLQVLGLDGRSPFEMLAVRVWKNGFEVEFNRPLDPRVGWDPESYYIEQWPFDVANGVAPHRDGIVYPVKSASVSPDRKKVFLEIENLKPSHVVYIRLLAPCLSEDGELPWSTEAWYTLNVIPEVGPGKVLAPPAKEPQNFLTDEEQAAGWRLLFDGKTAQGWHGYKKDAFPSGWQVKDGCLVRVGPAGDIITDDEFQDFELSLEWRISPAGNSGIFYRVTEDHAQPWETGPEYQILDNAEHADGREPKTSAASCYGLYAPLKDVTVPVGLFNQTRIVIQGNHVEHWLNAVKVVEYDLHSPQWQQLIRDSKFSTMPDYGSRPKGRIDLQDHGDKVWYRNIKIRTLPPAGGK